jgi:hypothetical protein
MNFVMHFVLPLRALCPKRMRTVPTAKLFVLVKGPAT